MRTRAINSKLVPAFKQFLSPLVPPAKATASERQAAPYPSQKALAAALEMDPNTVNRALVKGDHFDDVGCLKLAIVGNYSPSDVLRAANKDALASLIEYLYGKSTLTPDQTRLLTAWDRASDDARAAALLVLKLSPRSPTPTPDGGPRPKPHARTTKRTTKKHPR